MKKVLIIGAVILVIVFIIVLTTGGKPGIELDVASGQALAYAKLRSAIAEGNLNGSGVFSSDNMQKLKDLIKKADSSNQWFASNSGVFYGGLADTDSYQYTWISNGTYCATFCVKEENTDFFLCDYKFSADTVKGCMLFVE